MKILFQSPWKGFKWFFIYQQMQMFVSERTIRVETWSKILLLLSMFWKPCVIRAFAKLHLPPLGRFMVKQKSFQHLKMHRFRFRPLSMPPQNLQESL